MVRTLAIAAALVATSSALALPVAESASKLYTVEVSPGDVRKVTEEGKFQLKKEGHQFIDITNHPNLASEVRFDNVKARSYPTELAYVDTVEALLPDISIDKMTSGVKTYSSFYNRYYKSDTGVEASEWLLEQVQGVLTGVATAKAFEHADFPQNSIIVSIPGKTDKKVIVGAHLDSVGSIPTGKAPGADDNASGSMTTLESLRILMSDPKIANGSAENTLEFHWYAAEEGGLLGSADVYDQYSSDGEDVVAMLQQDMTGYESSTKELGVITDYVDASLTKFVELCIDTYTEVGYVESECGYGCSDHASANAAGFPSSFVIEAAFEDINPDIHSAKDTMDKVSIEHMAEHAKMIIGYAYELAFTSGL